MGIVNLQQIIITPLERISLAGGDILKAMKRNDPGYVDFGETYFSIIECGAVKAWKRHLQMTLNLIVPLGTVQFVFMDDLGNMSEEVIGAQRYVRLTVPNGIWFGFKGLDSPYSMVMNIADIAHDPSEVERKSISEIKFNW